jgi:hypothetical protein
MHEFKFSPWTLWQERSLLPGLHYPGIYVLAIADETFDSSKPFAWAKQVVYVGMTNSIGGLRARLQQFDNTIVGKTGHGGADRFRYKHQNYQQLVTQLFVAVAAFECDVKSQSSNDLLTMGDVAKFEYECFSEYVHRFGELPEFNNKKSSPKYSLTIGRRAT